jgi:hypothetical protein
VGAGPAAIVAERMLLRRLLNSAKRQKPHEKIYILEILI